MARIEERRNKDGEITSYRFRVSQGYKADGKQNIMVKTWKPPKGLTKTQLKKEVQKQAALFEAECDLGLTVDSNITFKQLYEMWLKEYAEPSLKKTTLTSYKAMAPNILESIGHIRLNKIQPHHLNDFYATLLGRAIKTNEAVMPTVDFKKYILVYDGKKYKRERMTQAELSRKAELSLTTIKQLLKGKAISVKSAQKITDVLGLDYKKVFDDVQRNQVTVATVKRYHALISGIFKHAVTQNIIPMNPCTRVRLPKAPKKEAVFLEESEANELFNALEDAPEPFRTAARLCMCTGVRRGELCALSWDNLNEKLLLVCVRKNLSYTKEFGLVEDTPKTKSSIRDIKISESAVEMMREYRKWQEEYKEKLGDKWTETGKIFTNETGGWLRPDTFSGWFRNFCKEHGFKNVHVHTLRHTAATLMIMNNIPLKVVSQRLGHNSTTVTNDIYTHVIKRADEMAAEALDQSLFTKKKKDESA